MFEFELAPLDEVPVWGTPPDLRLNWFGLSWGLYWLDLGTVRLLEYSPEARLLGSRPPARMPRFVDYQVARFHEDLIEILPDVLEPLPADVVAALEDGSVAATAGRLNQTRDAERQPREILDEALDVLYRRFFYTSDRVARTPGNGDERVPRAGNCLSPQVHGRDARTDRLRLRALVTSRGEDRPEGASRGATRARRLVGARALPALGPGGRESCARRAWPHP